MSSSWAYAIWVVVVLGGLGLWVASRRVAKRHLVARPSVVFARLARDPWLRVSLLLGWAWVGWHLFAR